MKEFFAGQGSERADQPPAVPATHAYSTTPPIPAAMRLLTASSLGSHATQLQAPFLQQQHQLAHQLCLHRQLQPSTMLAEPAGPSAAKSAAAEVDSLLQAVASMSQQIQHQREQLLQHQQQREQQRQHSPLRAAMDLYQALSGLRQPTASAAATSCGATALVPKRPGSFQPYAAAADHQCSRPARTQSSADLPHHMLTSNISSLRAPLPAPADRAQQSEVLGLTGLLGLLGPSLQQSTAERSMQQAAAAAAVAGGLGLASPISRNLPLRHSSQPCLAATATALPRLASAAAVWQADQADPAHQVQALLERLASNTAMLQQQQRLSAPHAAAIAALRMATPPATGAGAAADEGTPPPPAAAAAAAVPVAPADGSGLIGGTSSGVASDLELNIGRIGSDTSTGAGGGAAAATAAAAAVPHPGEAAHSQPGRINKKTLHQVLLEVMASKKQAISVVKEAITLGVLDPSLLAEAKSDTPQQPQPQASTASDAEARHQQLKRPRPGADATPAGNEDDTIFRKVARHMASATAAAVWEQTPAAGAAAAAQGSEGILGLAAGTPAAKPGGEQDAADGTTGQHDAAAPATAVAEDQGGQLHVATAAMEAVEAEALHVERYPSALSACTTHTGPDTQHLHNHQQVAAAAAAAAKVAAELAEPGADTCTVAAAATADEANQTTAVAAAAVPAVLPQRQLELLLRAIAVMCKSSKLNKALVAMLVPCATKATHAATAAATTAGPLGQLLDSQAQAAQPAPSAAAAAPGEPVDPAVLQQEVQQLKQQLMLATVSLSLKQQAVLKLQAEAQATAAAHTRQLHSITAAVQKLIAAANADDVRVSDKQVLVKIAADILKAVL